MAKVNPDSTMRAGTVISTLTKLLLRCCFKFFMWILLKVAHFLRIFFF